jgi:SAM-dependent methyltransferase
MTTLPENAFDCFICTSTFNFIFDVQKAVEGAHHLLKPGGVLLATVAGISQISRYDMDRWGDYWRFTSASVKRLFEPVFKGGLAIESFGNVLAATAFLQGVAVEDLPEKTLLDQQDPDYQMLITILAKKSS